MHGGTPLHGRIRVRGAKNLVSKAMVAALLGDTPSRLFDVPRIRDVEVVRGLLELHGVKVSDGADDGELVMDPTNVESASTDEINVHAGSSRIPILLCGPLLHRLGHAFIPDLGGCHIGPRPIDFHIQALRQFGAVVDKTPEGMHLTAPNGLHGTKLELPYPSVGATEQVLLTAVLAEGVTELRNAAVEPEIIDLICILQKMGAIITVHTDRVIEIQGVPRLHGYNHRPIPDRIEAASWAAAALATRGDVEVLGAQQADMMTFLNVFRSVGGEFEITDARTSRPGVTGQEGGIRFWHPGGELKAVALETDVHPGFMTDWQQPLVVALTQARGLSIVHETVYEQRLGYTDALNTDGRHHPGLPRLPGRHPVPVRPPQLQALRGHRRPEQAARRRPGHPRPARRLQPPDRRAGRRGHLPGVRRRPDQPRLRGLRGQAGRPRRTRRTALTLR